MLNIACKFIYILVISFKGDAGNAIKKHSPKLNQLFSQFATNQYGSVDCVTSWEAHKATTVSGPL